MVVIYHRIVDDTKIDEDLETRFNSVIPDQDRLNQFHHSFAKFSKVVTNAYPTAVIQPYGSFAANVALRNRSDLDLSVKIETRDRRHVVGKLHQTLYDNGFRNITVLRVKTKDLWGLHGFDHVYHVVFDMTLNAHDGLLVTSLLKSAVLSNIVCRKLIVLVKDFVKVQEINNPMEGTLKSIAYCILCIAFLQEIGFLPWMDRHESKELADQLADAKRFEVATRKFTPASTPRISNLLYMFFTYYGFDFNFKVDAVTINKPGPVEKEALGFPHFDNKGKVANRMVICSPFEKGDNFASSVDHDGMRKIVNAFRTASRMLRDGGSQIFLPFPANRQGCS